MTSKSDQGGDANSAPYDQASESTIHEVLQQYRQASIDQSREAMRSLYAIDAVHDFPFTRPGLPGQLRGRDAIVNWIVAGWESNLLKYERYRTIAIHDTTDSDTIIVEQEAIGTSTTTGPFALPNIVVLTVCRGQITQFRDYVNIGAAAEALGQQPEGS